MGPTPAGDTPRLTQGNRPTLKKKNVIFLISNRLATKFIPLDFKIKFNFLLYFSRVNKRYNVAMLNPESDYCNESRYVGEIEIVGELGPQLFHLTRR